MSQIKTSQILLPEGQAHSQLFFILHDEGAPPVNLPFLLGSIRNEFPDSVIHIATIDTAGLQDYGVREAGAAISRDASLAPQMAQDLSALEGEIVASQKTNGILSEATAVIGIGLAGSLVLALTLLEDVLAGRLVTFGSHFVAYPIELSLDMTLHLLHADKDPTVPSSLAREAHERMAQLQADATIDIAMNSGESFSEILIGKMFERLKTCVPLRYWKYATDESGGEASDRDPGAHLH